ncbi:transglycosylase [Staphylococcus phage phiSA_BS1]|uniref:Immunodominant staphylococcal antigen A n=2 Tax=Baoshanvirus TaxID=2732969 RepID=A0A2P1MXI3_9CAUD|nr:transglycosylase [Staphylococcus phage phiSA_BS1]YP_009799927.1 transglycosylase [Staphylococcus phage phiSA_BS2]AVP40272.1 immunodominant staphylococcal antigen A precursor [Staphylococcus phage phiSA_BS1]AVR55531.1 immunodominant staphylococcal antigen A precursor [Staphylococcus phage phiSA_BS2]
MKKTVFATLALGAAITFGGVSSNEASADEIDYNKLAEQAKTNAPEINNEPIQEGNYDFSFSDGEFTYHFYSYNGNFGYEYHTGSTQVNNTSSQLASQEQASEQKVDQQQAQFDTQSKQDAQPKQETTTQEAPKAVEAPKQETTTPVQKETKSVSGGSVKAQFLQAGGTEAMWDSIVMPESTGNPNATNGQYSGLFQMSPQSGNGTGSVEEQTKSAIKYANERYGSVENAISARQSKGWW